MKTREKIKFQRNKRLLAFMKTYSKLIEPVLSLKKSIETLQDLQNKIMENDAVTRQDTKAFTQKKSALRANLVKSAFTVSCALFSFALDSHDSAMQAEYDLTLSFFNNLPGEDFISLSRKILAKAKAVSESLTFYDITSENLLRCEKDIEAFAKAAKEIKSLAEAIKKAHEEISRLLKMADILIDKEINKRIFPFKQTNPSFYNEYMLVKILDENAIEEENSVKSPEMS